jgi:dihydrofolate reductase
VIVALVAAVARGGVIGRDGGLPWYLPEDLAHFRGVTLGHPVVMGRKTWESLPERFRPLPGRRNVVVTRNAAWRAEGAERAGSVEEALALVDRAERVSIIGGGDLFAAALPRANELLLTEIDLEVAGDTFFPPADGFTETAREEHVAADGTRFAFVTRRRDEKPDAQLSALADVAAELHGAGIDYWLFGGWAVDFYAGRVTRPHSDVDLAVWRVDAPRVAELLAAGGWTHAPDPEEDGGTGYERDGIRLELTFLVRDDSERILTPLEAFEAVWPEGAFGDDVRELGGTRARLVSLAALRSGKAEARDDPEEAALDAADLAVLESLGHDR